MSKEIIGDACAFIKGVNGEKSRYPRIGIAVRDGDRISIKLDTLPIDKMWEGWINIFPKGANTSGLSNNNLRANVPRPSKAYPDPDEDDIPF